VAGRHHKSAPERVSSENRPPPSPFGHARVARQRFGASGSVEMTACDAALQKAKNSVALNLAPLTIQQARRAVCTGRKVCGGLPQGGLAILSSRRTWCFALGMLGAGMALLGIGLAVSGRPQSLAIAAEATGAGWPGDASTNVVVSATALGEREVLICLVDTDRQRLAVYLADGRRSRLKLLAVRDISADWELSDWNNDPPLPRDIRARLKKPDEASGTADDGSAKTPGSKP
jgi:hypothetical protein